MSDGIDYQVGELLNLSDNDPHFPSIAACAAYVEKQDTGRTKTYGIWTGQRHGSELVQIIHEGETFVAVP